MSSLAVRNAIKGFLASGAPTEVQIDLTGEFQDLRELLAQNGVAVDAPWLGLEFIAFGEEPVSLAATNDQGLYRETGMVQLHVCTQGKIGAGAELVSRGEALLNLFRGVRIGSVVVEAVRPLNTGPGATLEFDAGYVSGTIDVEYYCDYSPGA